jgi:hypothetical protein
MDILHLEETIGLNELNDKIENLTGSRFFFELLIANFKNDENEKYKWSKPFDKKRLESFKETQKQILGENARTIIYRIKGMIFVNKLFPDGWKGKLIYGT